ncbi:response regulator [Patescibacteria group bacterium]|nr:response regulator [Patescibacteria group bacterium]MBU0777300.1 response regulator [Patescibacteria group bacterium]MBU0846120.1 response regulator [Patescibacteria group bacterium]MBU0923174.1 response regulator [Patescibacteria group bacterium]MBU1066888.1 response regulator [Patescibacteria group bacterium]
MPRILIIEDDPLMTRLYQKVFRFEKYDVDVASNGKLGLEKVKLEKPTLILLDIMMPEMNGLEVLTKLKADEETKKIPVIVLTNLAGTQDAETAMAKGAVRYIVKSEHDPKEVVKIVKEILAGYTRDKIPEVSKEKKE